MYKYKLEPLLHYKNFIEETLQKELAAFQKKLSDAEKKLNDYTRAKNRCLNILQQKQLKKITISENLLYFNFIDRLSLELEKQKQRVLEIKKKYNQKREALLEAVKNRKALDILKEKDIQKYRQKLLKDEQQFINEVAVNRFNRSR